MAKVIAIANQKGGVGKTTTCVNLSAALSQAHQQVLLVDLDPQGNATVSCGLSSVLADATINEVLLEKIALNSVIQCTSGGFDIAPANNNLTEAETLLLQLPLREYRLARALKKIQGQYDYVFIDCPPSLNMLTVNALAAADAALVTLQCEYFALEGLTALLNTIEKIRLTVNKKLYLEGILRTMFDSRTTLSNDVSAQLIEHFKDTVYAVYIPRNIRLAEAPSHGLPCLLYDKNSSGARAYMALAKEIIHRHENVDKNKNLFAPINLINGS